MKRFIIFFIALLTVTLASYAQPVTWTQVDDALSPFVFAGSGVLGNYFYSFGGQTQSEAQAFNLTTEQWEASTHPPVGWNRYGSASTVAAVYLIGWCTSWPTMGSSVQKFTPSGGGPSGTWNQMASFPLTVVGMAVAWDGGNYIYTAGGTDGNQLHLEAYKYDIANNTWTPIASMPFNMVWSGGAFLSGKFYVAGGSTTPQSLLEYNPDNNAWTTRTGPPSPIYWGGSTTSNDSLLFSVGGGGQNYPQSDAIQIYDPLADSWAQETPLPLVLGGNSARFVPPDKVISAGGYWQGQYVTFTYRGNGFPVGTTAAESVWHPLPAQFSLLQNYPNPFNATTNLTFELPNAGHASLRVFDLLGREAVMLRDGMMEAGTHRLTFDGSRLASGVYFARLEAGKFSQTKKLMLLK